jgi:hypothetical protein
MSSPPPEAAATPQRGSLDSSPNGSVGGERAETAIPHNGNTEVWHDVTATGAARPKLTQFVTRDFDPDEFLRDITGLTGLAAACEHAVGFRRYPMG